MMSQLARSLVRGRHISGRNFSGIGSPTWFDGINASHAAAFAPMSRYYSTTTEGLQIDLHRTLPASLDTPTRAPEQSRASHLYKTGRAYLTFYKTGIKNVFKCYRDSRALRQTLYARAGRVTLSQKELAARGLIERAEFQLLRRSRHDILRVPFFLVICTVTGELAPLVVLLLANQVPWTCRTPKQLEAKRRKDEERRTESASRLSESTLVACRVDDETKLCRQQLLHASTWLGTHRWNATPSFLLRRRLLRRREYLDIDDQLLRKEDINGNSLRGEDLRWALSDRGLTVSDKTDKEMRQALRTYLDQRDKHTLYWLVSRPMSLS